MMPRAEFYFRWSKHYVSSLVFFIICCNIIVLKRSLTSHFPMNIAAHCVPGNCKWMVKTVLKLLV